MSTAVKTTASGLATLGLVGAMNLASATGAAAHSVSPFWAHNDEGERCRVVHSNFLGIQGYNSTNCCDTFNTVVPSTGEHVRVYPGAQCRTEGGGGEGPGTNGGDTGGGNKGGGFSYNLQQVQPVQVANVTFDIKDLG